ncbi:MAG: elongation factor P maturation arginine rhamnosyltransferase EarP [Treponema sp.]|nr:elongation factor P maturation arginine rhamnosyltransferase EarP [Treponema sp.]
MTLDILCRVVDNYGDIGLVYRLAKAISGVDPTVGLRIHVDKLAAFHELCPEVEPGKQLQKLHEWTIIDWNIELPALREACASGGPPTRIVECFACNRPPALEILLFDRKRDDKRLIVNLEHLSAETWVDEIHRMRSATRHALVRKYIFMPGFTKASGGLIIDPTFRAMAGIWRAGRTRLSESTSVESQTVALATVTVPNPTATVPNSTVGEGATAPGPGEAGFAPPSHAALRLELAARAGLALAPGDETRPWFLVFSYQHDYSRIVDGIMSLGQGANMSGGGGADMSANMSAGGGDNMSANMSGGGGDNMGGGGADPVSRGTKASSRAPLVLVAQGLGAAPFLQAWRAKGETFPTMSIPFLPQEAWDEFILASDFAIVRGEESLARAALAGIPFVWHAYRQDGNHQLVKVQAILDRLRPFLSGAGAPASTIASYEALCLAFNDRLIDGPEASGGEREDIAPILKALPTLRPGFEAFAESLFANGDLTARLLEFMGTLAGP